jgi:hypothetical protein
LSHHATCGSARGAFHQALTVMISPDGRQALKYSYEEYTYLRSSVDIPLA